MTRYVAFLRAVNLGRRKVAMPAARASLEGLGYEDVASFVNSGNLIFTGTGKATGHEAAIRARLEDELGFEVTTFVRTAGAVRALATDKPFGTIAPGHTHMAVLVLTPPTAKQKAAAEALSNEMDEIVFRGRDAHWLIRSKSTDTTLSTAVWERALGHHTTTARNTTMLARLVDKL